MPTRAKGSVRRRASGAGSLEPSEIFAKIEACPPLMREQAKAAYLGKEVAWPVIFVDGYEQSSGHARLTFQYQPSEVKFIGATARLSDYPWLKSTRAGETIRLRGRIRSINTLAIELDLKELLLAHPTAHHVSTH